MSRSTYKISTAKTSEQIGETIRVFMQKEAFSSSQFRGERVLEKGPLFPGLYAFVTVKKMNNEIMIKAWYQYKQPPFDLTKDAQPAIFKLKKTSIGGIIRKIANADGSLSQYEANREQAVSSMSNICEFEYEIDDMRMKRIPNHCLRDPVEALIADLT